MRIEQAPRFVAVVLLGVALLAGTPLRSSAADGGAFTIGSGLAFTILIPDAGDNLTMFSAPEGNQFFGIGAAPGLRFGHVSPSRGFEFALGTGIMYVSDGDDNAHVLVFGLDFQKHFASQSSWNLFLGGDAGLSTADFFGEDVTQPYLGVMLGGRNIVSDDNGSIKLAVHLRHHLEDEDAFADSFNAVSFAMHFDLWIP